MIHLFHKWTKWEKYVADIRWVPKNGNPTMEFQQAKQRRHCEICGYKQSKKIDAY